MKASSFQIFLYKIKKKLKWEFAPTWVVYFPFLFYSLYWIAKTRSLTFFTAANPRIPNGGLFGESKYDILKMLPPSVIPTSILIENPSEWTPDSLLKRLHAAKIYFPFILKPDKGERGRGVLKISNEEDLSAYLRLYSFPVIAQSFITEKEEYGILYHRLPTATKGEVTSIVVKNFLSITGDGVNAMETLWLQNQRCLYHWELLQQQYQEKKHFIPKQGETIILVEIGNHSRGTTFLNGNHLINEKLTETIDKLAKQIPEFYIGRFDLKAENFEALCEGKLKIMELNGVGAEPGHIYDPSYPVWKSYRDLLGHWHNIAEIARFNYRSGYEKIPFSMIYSQFREYQAYQAKYFNP